jgi:acyl-CoA thioester hydrolase
MSNFRFYYPIQIRYADLDAQWHVNNARFLTILEQARLHYLLELGLWEGKSFLDLGVIIADIHIAYLSPIALLDEIRVGTRVARIGNKSMTFENEIQDGKDGSIKAKAEVVVVAYDFRSQQTQAVPAAWRKKISDYEGLRE